MKNKVFCIGLSRTGTTSICEALKILGYKTFHYPTQLFIHPEIICKEYSFKSHLKFNPYRAWTLKKEIKAFDKKYNSNILNEYDAFGDLPIPLYYKELDKKYKESKFIYTYRDEIKWLKSMKWLFEEGAVLWSHGEINHELNFATYGTTKYNKQKLIETYRNHHKKVTEYFNNRQNDLLSVNIDEQQVSFDILCKYLDTKASSEEFPRTNGSRNASKKMHIHYWLGRNIPFYGLMKRKLNLK